MWMCSSSICPAMLEACRIFPFYFSGSVCSLIDAIYTTDWVPQNMQEVQTSCFAVGPTLVLLCNRLCIQLMCSLAVIPHIDKLIAGVGRRT